MALTERVRGHYVGQFELFVDRQEKGCVRGAAEVKFQLPESSALYRRLACIDFIKNDNGVEGVLFEPEHVLSFEAFTCSAGTMRLDVAALRWDGVAIHHDLPEAPSLDAWFQRWFDPDDERHDPSARLGGVIHSLSITPGCVSVDFGTAPAESLLKLLEQFEKAGANGVTINDQAPTAR